MRLLLFGTAKPVIGPWYPSPKHTNVVVVEDSVVVVDEVVVDVIVVDVVVVDVAVLDVIVLVVVVVFEV